MWLITLCIHLSICLFTYLFIYMSIFIHLTINISICIYLFIYLYIYMPIQTAERPRASVYGRSLPGIAGSNPAGGMNVYLLWVSCIVS
jgi:hypothetical protein